MQHNEHGSITHQSSKAKFANGLIDEEWQTITCEKKGGHIAIWELNTTGKSLHLPGGRGGGGGGGGKSLHLPSWPKLCGTLLQNALPRLSIIFHMETNFLWAKFYLPPSLHAMLFIRNDLPKNRPTLHGGEGRGGGGGGGEGVNVARIQHKRQSVPHRFWPGL